MLSKRNGSSPGSYTIVWLAEQLSKQHKGTERRAVCKQKEAVNSTRRMEEVEHRLVLGIPTSIITAVCYLLLAAVLGVIFQHFRFSLSGRTEDKRFVDGEDGWGIFHMYMVFTTLVIAWRAYG